MNIGNNQGRSLAPSGVDDVVRQVLIKSWQKCIGMPGSLNPTLSFEAKVSRQMNSWETDRKILVSMQRSALKLLERSVHHAAPA